MNIVDKTLRVISFSTSDFYRRAYLHECNLQEPPFAVVDVTGFGANDFTAQHFETLEQAESAYIKAEAGVKHDILNYLGAKP